MWPSAERAALPVEGEPRLQQRQIKSPAIERYPPGARGQVLDEGGEHRRLFRRVTQKILTKDELLVFIDAEADEEDQRSRTPSKAGRLRIQENERAQINVS